MAFYRLIGSLADHPPGIVPCYASDLDAIVDTLAGIHAYWWGRTPPDGMVTGYWSRLRAVRGIWTPAQRHERDRERCVLARYHEDLVAAGVTGYDLAGLLDDYRRALISWVLVPVQDAGDGSAASYWRPKMDCLVAAYRDWDCDRLR